MVFSKTTKTFGPGDDAEMIRSPHVWPAFPFLPVKRYETKDGHLDTMQCGVIVVPGVKEDGGVVIYEANIVGLTIGMLMRAEEHAYASVDEALADGWIVD